MIYKGQTELSLRANTGVDITGATAMLIKYTDPDGNEGSFTASIYDASKGIINYDIVSSTDLNIIGKWVLWAYVTFVSGNSAAGKPFTLEIFNEGSIC